MSVKWTEEQQKVIDTRNRNLLVSAAAGSGKTAVLVERIIQMISEGDHPIDIDKLLVVTFTNAAAAEMKERVGDAIEKKLLENPNNKYLHRQLSLLQHASITTIHSFCLYVLRNYFHLIDLDPSFRIADETELILLRADVVKALLEEHYEQRNEQFYDLLESYSSNKSDDQLEDLILKIYTFSQSYPWPEKWLYDQVHLFDINNIDELSNTHWVGVIKDYIFNMCESLKEQLSYALDLCNESTGPIMYKENIIDDMAQLESLLKENSFEELYNIFSKIAFTTLSRKRGKEVDPDLKEEVKNIRTEAKKILEKIKDSYFFQSLDDTIDDLKRLLPINKTLIDLVIGFSNKYKEEKREKNIVDFNDLEHLALSLLIDATDNKPSVIAQELQNKFEEVLIDEYQDSNLVQETILKSVSRVDQGKPNIFMVGDVKQSIYKFRLAKPELFMDKYDTYTLEDSDYQRIDLHKNFRSRKEVLDSVNFIFYQVMSKKIGDVDYNKEAALYEGAAYSTCENGDCGGSTELHIIESKNNIEEIDEDISLTDREIEAKMIGKRIKDLMNSEEPYMVYDKRIDNYRPVQYRDIVILLRTISGWADVFTEVLLEEGIPAYSDTSSGYFETTEVKTIMSLLKVIDNPRQDIPLLSVLRSPIVGLNADELATIKNAYPECEYYDSIMNLLEEPFENELVGRLKGFFTKLEVWQEKVTYTPIYELVWDIYKDTNYYDYVSIMPSGKQRQANLDMLIEKASQFEKSSYKGLFNFIRLIDKLEKYQVDFGEASILGENEDLVRIMSIHKSKGLEFPVVFVSGLGKQFNKQDINQTINIHSELGLGPDYVNHKLRYKKPTIAKKAIQKKLELENLSEELRVLYVALTRAREKLILTGTVSSRSNLEKRLEKWTTVYNHSEVKLPYNIIAGANNYLDWIVPSLVRHKSGVKLLERVGKYSNPSSQLYNEGIDFHIQLFSLEDLLIKDVLEDIEKSNLKNKLLEGNLDDSNDELRNEVEERLSWEYRYKDEVNVHVKMTVSEIKKHSMDYEDEIPLMFKEEVIEIKPKFIEEVSQLTPTEKGTLMHKIMEQIPLGAMSDYKEIEKELQSLEERGFISDKERKTIFIKDILAFSNTELYKRMLKSDKDNKLFKEKQFVLGIKANELGEKYKSDELVLIQGVIDCFFEEEDDIILVDYKTDYIKEGQEDILIKRYTEQLNYYEKAIEQITGKKVRERMIYSFGLNKDIKC
ncbi:DNA helicase/exodeoxyribonuclease V subunit A [Natranaerovirga pectinivora]|uniref:ATP-dependent helicase/nuclease subunit A n=1 Tax=Natranaerovirga pectinivora TaxID=682400 RepID=A0A4R3MMS1_9FIRM|nr:helicase-exonuclease AddAB subunit AddA [Natranaerovirga pectinivora]TCT14337.1 DNA helicase/exodeoxyribonuclease V subunit A [Natranaerovirga pectinivora]